MHAINKAVILKLNSSVVSISMLDMGGLFSLTLTHSLSLMQNKQIKIEA